MKDKKSSVRMRKVALFVVLGLLAVLLLSACDTIQSQYPSDYVFSVGEEIVFSNGNGEEKLRFTVDGWKVINDKPVFAGVYEEQQDGDKVSSQLKGETYKFLIQIDYTCSGRINDLHFSAKNASGDVPLVRPDVIGEPYEDFDDEALLMACNDIEGVVLNIGCGVSSNIDAQVDFARQEGVLSVDKNSSAEELYSAVTEQYHKNVFLKSEIEKLEEKNSEQAVAIGVLITLLVAVIMIIMVRAIFKKKPKNLRNSGAHEDATQSLDGDSLESKEVSKQIKQIQPTLDSDKKFK